MRVSFLIVALLCASQARAQVTFDFFTGDTSKTSGMTSKGCWNSSSAACVTKWGASSTVSTLPTCSVSATCTLTESGAVNWAAHDFSMKCVGSSATGLTTCNANGTTISASSAGDSTFTPVSMTNIVGTLDGTGPGVYICFNRGTAAEWWVQVKSTSGGTFTTWAPAPTAFAGSTPIDGVRQVYFVHPNVLRPTGAYITAAHSLQRFRGCMAYQVTDNTTSTITFVRPAIASGLSGSYPDPNALINVGDSFSVDEAWGVEDFSSTQRAMRDPLGKAAYIISTSSFQLSGASNLGQYNGNASTLKYLGSEQINYFTTRRLIGWGFNTATFVPPKNMGMNSQSNVTENAAVCDGTSGFFNGIPIRGDWNSYWLGASANFNNTTTDKTYDAAGLGMDQPIESAVDGYAAETGNLVADVWDVRTETAMSDSLYQGTDNSGASSQFGSVGYNNNAPWYSHVDMGESDTFQGFGSIQTHKHVGYVVMASAPYIPAQRNGAGVAPLFVYRARNNDSLNYAKLALRDFVFCYNDPVCQVIGVTNKAGTNKSFNYDFPYPSGTSARQVNALPVQPAINGAGQFTFHAPGSLTAEEQTALNNLNARWGTAYTSFTQESVGNVLGTGARTAQASLASSSSSLIANAANPFQSTSPSLDVASMVEVTAGTCVGQIRRILTVTTTNVANDTANITPNWNGCTPDATTVYRVSPHYNRSSSCASTALADTVNTPFTSGMVGYQVWLMDVDSQTANSGPTRTTIASFTDSGHATLAGACPGSPRDLRYAVIAFKPTGVPTATGFMDENTGNATLGGGLTSPLNTYAMINGLRAGISPSVANDLDLYVQVLSMRMWEQNLRTIKNLLPYFPIKEPEAFDAANTELCKASAGMVDIWVAFPQSQCVGDFTSAGLLTSRIVVSESDGGVIYHASLTKPTLPGGNFSFGMIYGGSQAAHGAAINLRQQTGLSMVSQTGKHYWIGANYFRLVDDCLTPNGWGWVTCGNVTNDPFDNAYDGIEAVRTVSGTYLTGGVYDLAKNTYVTIPCNVTRGSQGPCTTTFPVNGAFVGVGNEKTDYGDLIGPFKAATFNPTTGVNAFFNAGTFLTVSAQIVASITSGSVEYGLGTSDSHSFSTPTTCSYGSTATITSSVATLTSLAPETTYCYRIKNGGGTIISPPGLTLHTDTGKVL